MTIVDTATIERLAGLDRYLGSQILGQVGKTETAELLTERLFGSREKLIRLDMSECMTLDSIDILRGANMTEDGILGRYYDRTEGAGLILFDEIEKGHRLILDLLLQILSAARFTTAAGRTLNLRGYVGDSNQ